MPYNVKGEQRNTGRTHFPKGVIPWNKGKTGVYSEAHRKMIGETTRKRLLKNHPFRGKHHSEETKDLIRIAAKNQVNRYKTPKGTLWSKERRMVQEMRKGIPYKRIKKLRIKPIIMNGKEYSPMWIELRKIIYKRDSWFCQECGIHCSKNIACHHIDYDTTNNDPSNLITLCSSCHAKTNFRRENWINRYTNRRIG